MWSALRFAIVGCAAVLAACSPERAAAPAGDSPATFLIEAAVVDFKAHVAPVGAEFRNVHAGVIRGEDGQTNNVLCGEFRGPQHPEWVAFATIQTDPYENWIGRVGAAQCASPNVTLETGADLSQALAARYAASE